MDYKKEVGQRLRDFAAKEHGSIAGLAKEMVITPESLYDYLKGKRLPGDRLKVRLEKANCNIVWLLTGVYPDPERQRKEIQIEIEDREILNYLKSKGLDALEKVKDVYEAYEPMLKVAERMAEYKTKPKGK